MIPKTHVVLLCLCTVFPAAVLGQDEAVYRGRTVAEWAAELAERPATELKDTEVRRNRWYATYALGQIGPVAANAVPVLTRVLDSSEHENAFVRAGSAWALGHIGPAAKEAVPSMRRWLGLEGYVSKQVTVRRSCAEALGNIGSSARDAIPELENLLKDPDAGVRLNAAVSLWQIDQHADAIPAILGELRRADDDTAYQACLALGRTGQAGLALGRTGEELDTVVKELIGALDHTGRDVQRAAALALGRMGPSTIPALEEVLDQSDETARFYAVQALARMGADAEPVLKKARDDESPEVRRAAARALALMRPDISGSAPPTPPSVDDKDEQVPVSTEQ
jgi:HEAT repeat protein